MGAGGTMLEVDGVVAVQVRLLRNQIRISRPESARVVVRGQAEGVGMLSEAVNVRVGGQVGFDAEISRFENEGMGRSGEENLLGVRAID